MYYEAYTHFFSLNRFFVAELMHSGDYELVGRELHYKGGVGSGRYIHYYIHKDALEFNSYTWDSTQDNASDHVQAWRDRLASYCSASYE